MAKLARIIEETNNNNLFIPLALTDTARGQIDARITFLNVITIVVPYLSFPIIDNRRAILTTTGSPGYIGVPAGEPGNRCEPK